MYYSSIGDIIKSKRGYQHSEWRNLICDLKVFKSELYVKSYKKVDSVSFIPKFYSDYYGLVLV